MIMINSLLIVGLLTMGVGAYASTPIEFNRHPQKQERQLQEEENTSEPEETALTFSHTFDLKTPTYLESVSTTPQNYTPSADYPCYTNIADTTINETFIKTINVRGSIRDENLIVGNLDRGNYFGVALPYQSNKTHETTSLWAIQIAPYNYISDANTSITIQLYGQIHNWISNDSNNIIFETHMLWSTNENWQRYIGVQHTNVYRYNYSVYESLTNGTLGTNYYHAMQYNNFDVGSTTTTDNFTYTQEIYLDSTKINYLFIYQEVYARDNDTDPYCIIEQGDHNTASTFQYANIFNSDNDYRNLTLSGEYVVPPSSYEVVDIPGLLWEILSMPFAFISQAFNLTLFPGTPYQVNISNLILTIFGVLVFIFIFKLLLKK